MLYLLVVMFGYWNSIMHNHNCIMMIQIMMILQVLY